LGDIRPTVSADDSRSIFTSLVRFFQNQSHLQNPFIYDTSDQSKYCNNPLINFLTLQQKEAQIKEDVTFTANLIRDHVEDFSTLIHKLPVCKSRMDTHQLTEYLFATPLSTLSTEIVQDLRKTTCEYSLVDLMLKIRSIKSTLEEKRKELEKPGLSSQEKAKISEGKRALKKELKDLQQKRSIDEERLYDLVIKPQSTSHAMLSKENMSTTAS